METGDVVCIWMSVRDDGREGVNKRRKQSEKNTVENLKG